MRGTSGQSLADYAIALAIIAIVVAAAMFLYGSQTIVILSNTSGGV